MFSKTELNDKLTTELRELAKSYGIENADSLRKIDLVEVLLHQQEIINAAKAASSDPYSEIEPVAAAPAPKAKRAPKVAAAAAAASEVVAEKPAVTEDKPVKKRARLNKDEAAPVARKRESVTLFDEPQHQQPERQPDRIIETEESVKPISALIEESAEVLPVAPKQKQEPKEKQEKPQRDENRQQKQPGGGNHH
uniref:Rho termination factor N-terminal domain-containing protein n=1 Tax=Pedobacter sp. UBA5917 TaxID=1947061 RepID=UPI0025D34A8E